MSTELRSLVLLHPFPMDASFWGPMWRELAEDCVLSSPEFPGFGAAPPVETPTIDGFADEVAQSIRSESGRPALIVGLSLGGYVALAIAERHPDVAAGFVLADTRADADTADGVAARNRAIDTVRIDGVAPYLDELLPRLLGPSAGTEAWERAQAISERQEPEAICTALEAIRDRADRTATLARIAVPTTVVVGEDDLLTPPDVARAMAAAIPGATVEVVSSAGHLSALEQPAAFAEVVRRRLDALPG